MKYGNDDHKVVYKKTLFINTLDYLNDSFLTQFFNVCKLRYEDALNYLLGLEIL